MAGFLNRLPLGFGEATGVLEMIAKDREESRLYNERLKMERDERARNLQARAEGREEGELVGRLKLLQNLNGDTPGTTEELLALGRERLLAMERDHPLRRLQVPGRLAVAGDALG